MSENLMSLTLLILSLSLLVAIDKRRLHYTKRAMPLTRIFYDDLEDLLRGGGLTAHQLKTILYVEQNLQNTKLVRTLALLELRKKILRQPVGGDLVSVLNYLSGSLEDSRRIGFDRAIFCGVLSLTYRSNLWGVLFRRLHFFRWFVFKVRDGDQPNPDFIDTYCGLVPRRLKLRTRV